MQRNRSGLIQYRWPKLAADSTKMPTPVAQAMAINCRKLRWNKISPALNWSRTAAETKARTRGVRDRNWQKNTTVPMNLAIAAMQQVTHVQSN